VPDGAENIDVVRDGDHWLMIYSRGLKNQHLAYAVSTDLVAWTFKDDIAIDRQWWMERRYGAPSVWRGADRWWTPLMGEDAKAFARVGLLTSPDGVRWTVLPAAAP
jgi:sucrose-6-phosphate hydrolase SacC (GH32 family)